MRITISLVSSSASRTYVQVRAASCKHRFKECARQCTCKAEGCSDLMRAATPFNQPDMFAPPLYAWPLHWLSGSIQRMSTSFIAAVNVPASVLGT